MPCELLAHHELVVAIGLGGLVRVDGNQWRLEAHLREEVAEGSTRAAHHRRVEGGGHGEALRDEALDREERLDILDRCGGTRQHDLSLAVVVRDHHVGVRAVEDRSDRLDRSVHRGHRTGRLRSFGHEDASLSRHTDHVGLGECATGVECRDLAEAVSADVLRLDADLS